MTTKQVQIRRDTATNIDAATPTAGEPAWDTTNKRLRVGDGSTLGGIHQSSAADVQSQNFVYATAGGTADVLTLTLTPAPGAYAAGQRFAFKAAATNTTAATMNVNTLGAKNIKKMKDGALASLVAGDIVSGGIYELFYDGTQFQIQGIGTTTQSPGSLVYLGTFTGSSSIDITSAMSSTYDDYIIILDKIVQSVGSVNLNIKFSSNNGSAWSGGSNYQYALSGTDSTGSAVTDNNNGTSAATIGVSTGTGGFDATIRLNGVNNTATGLKAFSGDAAWRNNSSRGVTARFGGVWSSGANALNAVQITPSSGTISSGSAKIYGIAKS